VIIHFRLQGDTRQVGEARAGADAVFSGWDSLVLWTMARTDEPPNPGAGSGGRSGLPGLSLPSSCAACAGPRYEATHCWGRSIRPYG
jgi:hypothetical protein